VLAALANIAIVPIEACDLLGHRSQYTFVYTNVNILLGGTGSGLGRYFIMNEDRAEYYRRQAELCLEQAELAPDELMRERMRFLADEWLKMAARAAVRTAA